MTTQLDLLAARLRPEPPPAPKYSAFAELGPRAALDLLIREIQELYLEDDTPWVFGVSGGKDSSATVQLGWLAIRALPPEKRRKTVYVISTDTMVENPIVSAWATSMLEQMRRAAAEQGLPIEVHQLKPVVKDSFWVCLIGKGYAAPRPKFRWCTERLKINPSHGFIKNMVEGAGRTVLVLGTRKGESSSRRRSMERAEEAGRVRDRLSPNMELPGSFVYSPIEDWTTEDVWSFLFQVPNPWGGDNRALFKMYAGASDSAECPLVMDLSTPSCGQSRFGCWVCTMVEQDKSMAAMIRNDPDKDWMAPMLDLRDELDISDDRHLRDFRRMSGKVQMFHDRPIPGPYTQEARAHWLRRLLGVQREVQENAPAPFTGIELISLDELKEIRRIWIEVKHEIEDKVPTIYLEATGREFPGTAHFYSNEAFQPEDLEMLRGLTSNDLEYQLLRGLLHVEQRYRTHANRSGILGELEKEFKRHGMSSQEEAIDRARLEQKLMEAARVGDRAALEALLGESLADDFSV